MSERSFAIKPFAYSTLFLAGVAAFTFSLLAVIDQYTAPFLAANAQHALLNQLNTLVPADRYDNALAEDRVSLMIPELDAKKPVVIYRARQQQQPIASLLQVTAPNGYSGDIRLLVAIWADGSLAGVRVLAHKETPGLGDYIEEQRSDWIHQFAHKSLSNPSPERWKVKKDGGIFTYHTGATITARAIVATTAKTLAWVSAHQADIYASTAVSD